MPLLDFNDWTVLDGKINLVPENILGLAPPKETDLFRGQ